MSAIAIDKQKQIEARWKWGLRAASLVLLAIVWEFLGRAIDNLLLPTFLETVDGFVKAVQTDDFWKAVWVSNQAMLLGFIIAMVVAIPLGLLTGRWKRAEDFADIYLNILLVTPISALTPIIILSLGLGLPARVFVVFLFSFVFTAVNTRTGLRTIDPSLIEMARSFGSSERQLWQKILLPGALPAIMTGVRVSLGRAITGMVVVELLMVAVGVGREIIIQQQAFNAGGVYAVVFIVVAEAVILMELATRLEKRLIPWEDEIAVA